MRIGFGDSVYGAGGKHGVLHTQRPEQPVLHRLREWLAIDFFSDEAEQRVVGVVVLVGCPGREVWWVRERNRQQFGRGPNLGRVTVDARRDFGSNGSNCRDRYAFPAVRRW